MFFVKEQTLKDNIHHPENICYNNASSSSTSIKNSNTTFITTTVISEPAIIADTDKPQEIVNRKEEDFSYLIDYNKNFNMLLPDNSNDNLYDTIPSSIYLPHKNFEDYGEALLSPEGSLAEYELFHGLSYTDDADNKTKLQNDGYNGMDTPTSQRSPGLPEDSEIFTMEDCIPPNNIHFSQTVDVNYFSATCSNNNNNNNDNNYKIYLNDDDNDLDMEEFQNIKTSNLIDSSVLKRKMETTNTQQLPMKKTRPNLKLHITTANFDDKITTSKIVDSVLEMEEKQNFQESNTYTDKSRVQSPSFDDLANMNTNNNIPPSPLLDVGTENYPLFFNHIINNKDNNNNNCMQKNIFLEQQIDTLEEPLDQSSNNTNLSIDDGIIKDENPPSVSSSQYFWSTSDDTRSATPATPSQPKRRRGRPRTEHRLEPTAEELRDLTEEDKKQKILRARNNKASQISRDKKRSKAQLAEDEKIFEEARNKELKKILSKLEKEEAMCKILFQKCMANKV